MEKLGEEREETHRERLELQKACQLMKEEMQSTHQLQMETQSACQLMREELLGEVWKPGDDGPILERVGGANLPADGGGTASAN
jgi:hypothetical protein